MTSLHTIEDLISDFPVKIYLKEPMNFQVINENRKTIHIKSYIHCPQAAKKRNSLKLIPYFKQNNLIKECELGLGSVKLISAKELEETLLSLFKEGITMYNI